MIKSVVGKRSLCSPLLSSKQHKLQILLTSSSRWFHQQNIPNLPLFQQAQEITTQNKCAIVNNNSSDKIHQQIFSYAQLLRDSGKLANELCAACKQEKDLNGKRISFLFDPSYDYVVVQWAIWRAGGVAVPLCNTHPLHEMEYYVEDSQSEVLVYNSKFASFLEPLQSKYPNVQFLKYDSFTPATSPVPSTSLTSFPIDMEKNALIVYTSGTTGKPKGVVTTHKNISAQSKALIDAWEWKSSDHILHTLPLHHVHGIINCLTCALWSGASVEFIKFAPLAIWERLVDSAHQSPASPIPAVTLYMAVPTIYVKLITQFENSSEEKQKQYAHAASKLRLMVSGSAALPEPIFARWKEITGHTLLERYGMTEFGMALSNPLYPVKERKSGFVGKPLPGVQVKIVPETSSSEEGEIYVKGDNVFKQYWNKEKATQETFDPEGWFKTGDVGIVKDGVYKILGRRSVDIIKSRGYKISALEIERVLLGHLLIRECAVLGIDDVEQGQRIAAFLVFKEDQPQTEQEQQEVIENLKEWLKEKLAHYKIPSVWKIVSEIPKNAMGKVNKKDLAKTFSNK